MGTDRHQFSFRYESCGVGIADVIIRSGVQEAIFHSSYIGPNPLKDMTEAVADLLLEKTERCFLHWKDEPGTLSVELNREEDTLYILVKEYEGDRNEGENDDKWKTSIDAEVPFQEVIETVRQEAERNLRLHGIAGFTRDWIQEEEAFPLAALLVLRGIKVESDHDTWICQSSFEREVEMLKEILSGD